MDPEAARTPKFDQVWSAEALDDSTLIDAFLLHGVVFLQYPEDDHIMKYAHKTQELASSFFDEDQDGKNVFSTGQAVGDAGYQLRPVLKEQYQLRYGLGIHNPNVFTSKKFVKVFGKFEKFSRTFLERIFGENYKSLEELLDPPPAERDESYTTSSVLTLNRYFNGPDSPEWACPSHSDSAFITLALLPAQGIQFFDKSKEIWVDIHASCDSKPNLVIFGGDALAKTCGLPHLSSLHRVQKTEERRQSIIFKFRPRPELVGPRGDADYALSVAHFKWFAQQRATSANGAGQASPPALPVPVLIELFRRLDSGIDLARCSQVCAHWRAAAANRALWKYLAISEHHVIGTGASIDWKELYISRHLSSELEKSESSSQQEVARSESPPHRELKQPYKPPPAPVTPLLPEYLLQQIQDMPKKISKPIKFPKDCPNMLNAKITLVGSDSVGKTCSMIMYATNNFPSDYVPTVFDEYTANVQLDGRTFAMGLWDTAGNEDYDRLRHLSYPGTNCFVLMFSVGSRGSFDLAETKFIAEIRSSCPDTPILLVGTKVDLYMSDVPKEQLVSLEEAQETARRNKLAGYLQLSSLADRGVQEMFHTALRLCWRFGGTNPEGNHETGNRKCTIQ